MVLKKGHYAKQESGWLGRLVSHPAGALAAHWTFQGMLHMDGTERAFKLGLDALGALALGTLLRKWLGVPPAYGLGLAGAHTLNFLFNGQIFGVLKHYGGLKRTWLEFSEEVDCFRRRALAEPSIVYAAAYGSLAREHWTPTSDLDVRVVRAPGVLNGLRASWFALGERTRALWHGFPLDLLVLDSYTALQRMAEREPVVLVARGEGI